MRKSRWLPVLLLSTVLSVVSVAAGQEEIFDVTPLRDGNSFLLGLAASGDPPPEVKEDIGGLFLEAQIAGDVPLWGQENVRRLAGNVASDDKYHWKRQAYASMLLRLRMHGGDSYPIPPPSFMPKFTYQFMGFRKEKPKTEGRPGASMRVYSLAYGHHSNGQRGCHFMVEDMASCPLSADSTTKDLKLNVTDGNFSTHYFQAEVQHRIISLNSGGTPMVELIFDGSAEQHMPSGMKGALPEAIAVRYGKTRVRGSVTVLDYGAFGLDRLALRLTHGRVFGGEVKEPILWGLEVFAYPGWSTDVGFYLRSYAGQDPYNINFEEGLRRFELGLTFGWESILGGLPGRF